MVREGMKNDGSIRKGLVGEYFEQPICLECFIDLRKIDCPKCNGWGGISVPRGESSDGVLYFDMYNCQECNSQGYIWVCPQEADHPFTDLKND